MKKTISLVLSILMLLSITAGMNLSAYADLTNGKCGDNVTYSFDSMSGTLTISGYGPMYDYYDLSSLSPFYNKKQIRNVIIGDDITYVGYYTFG